MPFCAVILVNWNSWDYLFPCLDALAGQTFGDFRTVVVDNASTERVPAQRLEEYPGVSSILNAENRGFAAANNQAVRLVEDCEWVVLLNPDTLPEKTWLEKLRSAALAHPEFTVFGSRLVLAESPDLLDGTGDVYHISGLCWRSGHGCPISSAPKKPEEIFSPCGAAAMYRRSDFLAVGGFDEDFFCYNEDVDLGFRLRLAGARALSVPDSIVRHYGSATTSVRSDFSVYYGHRNLVWTWLKDMPFVLLLLFFPLHLLYNLACIGLYIRRGQGRVIVQAKLDALRGAPGFLAKRSAIHGGRQTNILQLLKIMNKSLILGPEKKYRSSS